MATEAEILTRREWLLRTQAELRGLSPAARNLSVYRTISAQDFLDRHYALNRPALLRGEIMGWPALSRWTPQYLKERIGSAKIEYQGGRDADEEYERRKNKHRYRRPFNEFIDLITAEGARNDIYLTAYNNEYNAKVLAPLTEDLGFIDHLLDRNARYPHGMMWIGPKGTFTPLHHDLTNNLLVQLVGTKRILLIAADEAPRLYNDFHVFSEVQDVEKIDLAKYPAFAGLRAMRIDLQPGDALFIPIGWWHQVLATDFSISITYTNFRWRNDFHTGFPTR